MGVNFRYATINDIETLNSISLESKKYWKYPAEWIKKWKNDLKISFEDVFEQKTILIEIKNKIIGFCTITENLKYYEIEHLWISPKFIGKGYGKLLLNHSIATLIKENKEIIVTADPHAEPFYNKQGFTTFKKVESYPKGRFLPVMKKL